MRIDHKLQRIQVDSFEISDELVYRFFISLPENERETALLRAIRIGVLATMEDRFRLSFLRQLMTWGYNWKI